MDDPGPGPYDCLSAREREIVRLVAKGHPNKVVGAILDISPWTVASYLRRVFSKLGVSSRTAMVALFVADEAARELKPEETRRSNAG